mgnify:FL=1
MSNRIEGVIRENVVFTIDKEGINIYIPIDAIAQLIAQPFFEAGLRPKIEVDVARGRVKITIAAGDLRKIAMSAVPNSPQAQALMAELLKMLGGG